jgi:hypothetical protein
MSGKRDTRTPHMKKADAAGGKRTGVAGGVAHKESERPCQDELAAARLERDGLRAALRNYEIQIAQLRGALEWIRRGADNGTGEACIRAASEALDA